MELKPIRKATRATLVGEVKGRFLTGLGQQALLAGADIVSEGMTEEIDGQGPVYHGSTLVSVELDRDDLAPLSAIIGPAGLVTAARRSIGLHVRLLRLARREAERRSAPLLPRGMRTEMEFKIEGRRLLMDIGIECPLAEPATRLEDSAGEEG